MGMTLSQFRRFMTAADTTLADLFPATVVIGGTEYAASGVGGNAALQFLEEGGQAPMGTRFFRISKTLLAARPETGTFLRWTDSPTGEQTFTITECPDRPHETSWFLRCEPSDR